MYPEVRPQGDLYLRSDRNFTFDCYVTELPFSYETFLLRRDRDGIYDIFKRNSITMKAGDQLSVNYAAFAMHQCRVDLPSQIASLYSKSLLVSFKGSSKFSFFLEEMTLVFTFFLFTKKRFNILLINLSFEHKELISTWFFIT